MGGRYTAKAAARGKTAVPVIEAACLLADRVFDDTQTPAGA